MILEKKKILYVQKKIKIADVLLSPLRNSDFFTFKKQKKDFFRLKNKRKREERASA